ncbi:hypothetical protein [Micromonospora carbonacea]|uniref:Uncharacterized protein n=2 Tax=Micromonospora carbonacea TaxID=47853 RepID=A0A1C4YEH4_9ACTN|nr:hypothetical protein [Micromonospora carbonacea]SCF19084.1 hypothetical protein GA0070563_10661 [Micromonospora carbonacea]
MMSFNAVHTLTGCLLDVEDRADQLGWGRPPLLLLIQDRPAPCTTSGTRRELRAAHLPLNDARMGRYRAGLADFLPDLAAALTADKHLRRPTLAACVDIDLITELLAEPAPGLRLLAWAVCYEDVLVESAEPHEIRRVDAVDADQRGYQVTRLRGEQHPIVFIDEHLDDDEAAAQSGLARLVEATSRPDPPPPPPRTA